MNFELRQEFRIEAARRLTKLPADHPCSRLHGHSFKIQLILRGPLNEKIGWLRDYHEIAQTIKPVLNQLDHHVLNDVSGLENPTSELIALWLYQKIKPLISELHQVVVSETSETECRFPI